MHAPRSPASPTAQRSRRTMSGTRRSPRAGPARWSSATMSSSCRVPTTSCSPRTTRTRTFKRTCCRSSEQPSRRAYTAPCAVLGGSWRTRPRRSPSSEAPRPHDFPRRRGIVIPSLFRCEDSRLIAWLGTGLLGGNFVRNMLDRGETVQVWNRSPEKARALEADGAKAFAEAADAAAVDSVLEPLRDIILPTAVILDHTTLAPTPTGERVARWKTRGRTYVHAPVFMGPKNARDASGLMLLSGDPAVRARVKPLLAPMTGKIVELGDDPTRGAAFKLFGNLMLLVITGGLADVYTLSHSLGIDPKDAHALFSEFNPGNAIQGRGKQMAEGIYTPPSFELTMARKDLRLMEEEAARHGDKLDVVPAVGKLFERYIAAGHGTEDAGVVGSGRA